MFDILEKIHEKHDGLEAVIVFDEQTISVKETSQQIAEKLLLFNK